MSEPTSETTVLSTFFELLAGLGLVVPYQTDGTSTIPVFAAHEMPDDQNTILALMIYNYKRDQVQTDAAATQLRRYDIQFKLRSQIEEELILKQLIAIFEAVEAAMPYTSLDGTHKLEAVYLKSGPFKLAVDRRERILYVANVRVSFRLFGG